MAVSVFLWKEYWMSSTADKSQNIYHYVFLFPVHEMIFFVGKTELGMGPFGGHHIMHFGDESLDLSI